MNIHVTDMRQFASCRMRWFFSSPHGLNMEPNLTPEPLFIGSLFHTAVEVWHRCIATGKVSEDDAFAAGLEALARDAEEKFSSTAFLKAHRKTDQYADAVDLTASMFENFCMWAPGRWETILGEVEELRRVRLPTPKGFASRCVIEGKPDAIVRDRSDKLWILEVKTAGRRYGMSPDLYIDIQMGAYMWMLKKLGIDVEGVLRLTCFKLLPKEPEITQKGRLSRRKITTTKELVLRAIERHSLPVGDYVDWLAELEEQPHPCFQLDPFRYTGSELEMIARRLYRIYRQMSKPVLYTNEGPMTCRWCSFVEPCRYANKGQDYKWILEEEFHERE